MLVTCPKCRSPRHRQYISINLLTRTRTTKLQTRCPPDKRLHHRGWLTSRKYDLYQVQQLTYFTKTLFNTIKILFPLDLFLGVPTSFGGTLIHRKFHVGAYVCGNYQNFSLSPKVQKFIAYPKFLCF